MPAVKGDLGMRVDPKLLGDEEERISREEAAADGVAVGQSLQLKGWTLNLPGRTFFQRKKMETPSSQHLPREGPSNDGHLHLNFFFFL